MQKRQSVKSLEPSGAISSVFMLASASMQQSRNGPFWRLELCDATGTVEAKIWNPLSQEYTHFVPGSLVEVQGRAALFRDQLQITVDKIHILSEEECAAQDMRDFVPSSPRPVQEMWDELAMLCENEFTHAPWRKFIFSVLKDTDIAEGWKNAPAAKNVHHAYRGGLLEHSLSVARLCLRLAAQYSHIDKEILLAGALLHDLGKIWEFSDGVVHEYTNAGRLLGHTYLILEQLLPLLQKSGLEPELIQHFKHLVISHHGEHEFGAACIPQTSEAFLLHYADMIDARMAQCQALFHNTDDGYVGWSSWQPTLSRYVHQPYRTPVKKPVASPRAARTSPAEEQCLSLLKA